MANKKRIVKQAEDFGSPPEKLEQFYGMNLDAKQTEFRDAIWSPDYDIIFCNSVAGTGKSSIAIGTANLLVKYGRYKRIVYMVSPTQEFRTGFLPGDIDKKMSPYFAPLFDLAADFGINPYTDINVCNEEWDQQNDGYIDCMSHTYQRGRNIDDNTVLIVDEAENLYKDELKKVLTRVHDHTKTIVIGHTGQCDLYHHPENSGFAPYIQHFDGQPRCKVCELDVNYRGWVSNWADKL